MSGVVWRRSSVCAPEDCCVEVAPGVRVRDSKHPDLPPLTLTAGLFGAVINHLKET